MYLLDENYIGDGSTITSSTISSSAAISSLAAEILMVTTNNPFDDEVVVLVSSHPIVGNVKMKVVNSAPLWRISKVWAAVNDPRSKPLMTQEL